MFSHLYKCMYMQEEHAYLVEKKNMDADNRCAK